MDAKDVDLIISNNPNSCYYSLLHILGGAIGQADLRPREAEFLRHRAESAAAAVRPTCGLDCDDHCPVSGRAEHDSVD